MANATWLANPGSGDFNTGTNWDPATVPRDTAFFGTSNVTSLTVSDGVLIGGWTFNAGADDYDFTFNQSISFDGAGIAINGGSATITIDAGQTEFIEGSSAGSATIINNNALSFVSDATAGSADITNNNALTFSTNSTAGSADITNGSALNFRDSSTAGSADITNNNAIRFFDTTTADGATITNNQNLFFLVDSSAGSAQITNNSALLFSGTSGAGTATITHNIGGLTFDTSSSAENATIINGEEVNFRNTSTAGNASITTANGSLTTFFNTSSTGQATFVTNTGGTVDFSSTTGGNNDNKLNASSIAGGGNYKLGANELTTGIDDSSTEVSGVISGAGGSLIKTGTGTFTLSGTNTYTGATMIDGGILQVDGSIASSEVTVTDGTTLQGGGTTGAVNVNAGGTVGPGASAGILSTGAIAFAAASTLAIELGGETAGSGHDQLAVTGTVDLGGTTLDFSLIGGFDPSTTTQTDFVIIDNDGTGDAVTGTFAGLAEGDEFAFDGRLFTVSYKGGDGNDVVLTNEGASINGTGAGETIDGTSAPAGEHTATELRDVINGLNGNDQLSGLGGNDTLDGGKDNDTLRGGDGDDMLIGGRNKDKLFGDAGDDTFIFTHKNDSVRGGQRDKIQDFDRSDDLIDLSQVDAKNGGGNQKFKWIGKHDFHDKARELRYEDKGKKVIVQGDTNGDGKADFEILVKVGALSDDDFVL